MGDKRAYKMALGGICLGLSVVFMFAGSFVPGIELTLYAISSLFIAIMIIETGPKGGVILYVAAILLGLLLVPNKLGILPYACLFGLYGIVKFYIEKIKKPVGQIALKLLFFASALTIGFVFFKELFIGNISLPDMPIAVIIAAGTLFLMLYDAIYTFVINMYLHRIKRSKMPKNINVYSEGKEGDKEEQ